ncbi:ERCC4-type endonuclease domain protein [Halophage HF1]|uniref:ERCC4 domain-containing protein EP364R n=2 Tax=Haloferacalesvirus TaxID=2843389 RepID=Q8V6S7_9CAUD|nr:ERCC4-type nuclease [Halorubrum phage HF2]NP_861615.1 ERCC4-type nuclease [Halophage HF1]AAL54949.1 ERCC4-type endonuclease domain protein [Halorubrum phage HF2]AAO61326.1 ERCC4-type endonuclease domain protein [Halophage HF1]QIR31126.1 ERCC4-type endonuclease domain protein [Halorubrum virus Hardycor2]
MSEFTILRDTREHEGHGYWFEDYPVDVKEQKLRTGDYAVEQPGYYGKHGTYVPPFAVERKAKGDFLNSITHERDRFERELERADDWDAPMPVVVEAPWLDFTQGNYYRNVNPNSIIGTVEKWPGYYNVDFFFKPTVSDSEKFTFQFLRWWNNRS